MGISTPYKYDPPTNIADWLEFHCLASDSKKVRVHNLVSAMELDLEYEVEDIGEEDAQNEAIVAHTLEEINLRKYIMEDTYPFEISSGGDILSLGESISDGGYVYLYCLLITHASNSNIFTDQNIYRDSEDTHRDLFQICATLCGAGECGGPSISFGFPRPDGSGFLEKLRETYMLFGEGSIKSDNFPRNPSDEKDAGIDVIAWEIARDGLPGRTYLLGQAASGHNWQDKSVVGIIGSFHFDWFERQPASHPTPAMFIPFCMPYDGKGIKSQEQLAQEMESLTVRFGRIFYRYRIPVKVAEAIKLAASGIQPIERIEHVERIKKWVARMQERLVSEEISET